MNNKELLEKIKKTAARDRAKRKDLRYLRVMAFFTQKGFLHANKDFTPWYAGRLLVADAIWAGKNLEPRILEILPAAIARLPKMFILNEKTPKTLINAVKALKNLEEFGPDFFGIKYEKYKVWMDLNLKDKRTKPTSKKKIMRSFRLSPEAIEMINRKQDNTGLSASDLIEALLLA